MTVATTGRLFRNMRLAREHAEALAAQDQRGPEYTYATVDRRALWAAIDFLQTISGSKDSLPGNRPAIRRY